MALSLQQIYRRNALWLSIVFTAIVFLQILLFTAWDMRTDSKRELAIQATMLARLMSSDSGALRSAADNPQLLFACRFDEQGKVVAGVRGAQYLNLKSQLRLRDKALEQCAQYGTITPGAHAISYRSDLPHQYLPRSDGQLLLVAVPSQFLEHFGGAPALFLLSIVAFVALFANWSLGMQRTILKPIRQIATTAQRVTLYKDYSLRVAPGGQDEHPQEVNLLIDSFNGMLAEVEDRNARLIRKTIELEKSREDAEAANVAKSQFLANISHELRTPLNAIIGFSSMIGGQQFGPIDEKYVEYSEDIKDSGRHLLDLINDIIDLSNAESGRMTMHFEQLAFPKVLDKALNIVAGQAQERNITLVRDLPEKLPKIIADRVRLVQILLNLLSNAVKFTEPGGEVKVRVRAETGRSGVVYFTIEVEDNGIGMTEEEVAKAFAMFTQGDAGLNRRHEGTGLGLSLTKRLVELHHGRISIESRKAVGTKVIIRLVSDPALLD